MATPPALDELRAIAEPLSADQPADPLAEAVAAALGRAVDAIAGPMRLAVTGQIKRGKSTLVNALARTRIAPTGVDEVTVEFQEFRFDQDPSAAGAATRAAPRSGLRRRAPAHVVRAVRAALPDELRLIDTPGLDSPINDTRGNTGLRADCAVHLFHRHVHETDVKYLRRLLVEEGTQPLPSRVLGVINACDLSWPPGPDDPEAVDPLEFHPMRHYAAKVIRQIERNPVNHDLFYSVLPVAALVAEGGWALTPTQIDTLATLAKDCEERVLADHLTSVARFVAADLAVDPAARQALVQQLGLWGVHLACRYLRGPSADEAGLRRHLDEESGVARLRAVIVEHFVGRGTFIKLEQHLRRVERVLADGRTRLHLGGVPMQAQVVDASMRLERLRATSLGLHELALVELIPRHAHRMTDAEAVHLAELTGTSGTSCMERLGLPTDSPVPALLRRAFERHRYWCRRVPSLPLLAPLVVRAYERLIGRIAAARSLLDSLD